MSAMRTRALAAALSVVSIASVAAAADPARLLPWKPLAGLIGGERARYVGTVADASGKVFDRYDVVVTVAAVHTVAPEETPDVIIAVAERGGAPKDRSLPREADARHVIDLLRLLPRGVPLDGLAASPAKARLRGKDVDATRVALEAPLPGGAGTVAFEALFARGAGPLGLVFSRTAVAGGGAGVATLEIQD